jgi:hypothetical protein
MVGEARRSRLVAASPILVAQDSPAGRALPRNEITDMRVLRRDRIGGLIHEYSQIV